MFRSRRKRSGKPCPIGSARVALRTCSLRTPDHRLRPARWSDAGRTAWTPLPASGGDRLRGNNASHTGSVIPDAPPRPAPRAPAADCRTPPRPAGSSHARAHRPGTPHHGAAPATLRRPNRPRPSIQVIVADGLSRSANTGRRRRRASPPRPAAGVPASVTRANGGAQRTSRTEQAMDSSTRSRRSPAMIRESAATTSTSATAGDAEPPSSPRPVTGVPAPPSFGRTGALSARAGPGRRWIPALEAGAPRR